MLLTFAEVVLQLFLYWVIIRDELKAVNHSLALFYVGRKPQLNFNSEKLF